MAREPNPSTAANFCESNKQHRNPIATRNVSTRELTHTRSEQSSRNFELQTSSSENTQANNNLNWLFVAAQGYEESQLNQNRRSSVGTVGVMQITPDTAAFVTLKGPTTTFRPA